jgi:tyrosinase
MALFQARYPDTWVESYKDDVGSFAIEKGTNLDGASPLSPFHMNAKGEFWTSNTIANIESFGYTYPELANHPDNATLTQYINMLYRPQTQALNANNTLTTRDENNRTADAIDWVAEVKLPVDVKKTYSVRAFLGEFDPNPENWPTDPSYVGQVASLGSKMDTGIITTANIQLANDLAERFKQGKLKSLEKEDVIEYLKANFRWEIQQAVCISQASLLL